MNMNKDRILSIAGLGLLTGLSFSVLQGCDDGPGIPGCDISCPAEGIAQGNASISGIAEVDAFFGAVIDVSAAANGISSSLQAQLDAIALSVGLEPGAAAADIKAGVEAKLAAYIDVDAGLKISFQPPRCEASVEVAVAAAAACDASVDPGSASVECSGGCEVQGGVMASCSADATLTCTGTAPSFACEGSCEGSCELDLAASCEGTCRGTCTGECTVRDAQGNCAGECTGDCQGTCELSAGGNCSGSCTGSCTYQPGAAGCEADASAKCEAQAGGSVQCEGRCEGQVTPPSVKAECEASVEAKANASIECRPPALEVTWQWNVAAGIDTDLTAQAEFRAWLQGFKGHLGVMLAAKAKADILIDSLGNLGTAGVAAIEGATGLVGSGDIVGTFKLTTCAIPQLGAAAQVVTSASASLSASAAASVEVFSAVGI
jgi:hypothetical protein